jgi:alpha-glucoside transport system substrate-binding protein
VETEIIEGNNTDNFDIAIIPNPQGVVNLGERGFLYPITIALEEDKIQKNYSNHLQNIMTSDQDNKMYGVLFRLIPNSLIWYDVEKYKEIGSPKFNDFEEMVSFTKENVSNGNPLWCMDIESGASTGWIASNWLEDIILHEYGPNVYDNWSEQKITPKNKDIKQSISSIGEIIFINNAIYGGKERIISKEFRNNYRNLVDRDNTCVFSWSGHFAKMYFPSDKTYGIDYDFFKFPSTNNRNALVGLGDSLVILNSSEESIEVFNSLTSNGFGQDWTSHRDSMFISANKNSIINEIKNPLLLKETTLIKNALNEDLFRYDASELMERRIGADHLLTALKKYILSGNLVINLITQELASQY